MHFFLLAKRKTCTKKKTHEPVLKKKLTSPHVNAYYRKAFSLKRKTLEKETYLSPCRCLL